MKENLQKLLKGKENGMFAISGLWRRNNKRGKSLIEEPDYVRTVPYDGGKYIDPDAFLDNPEIQ